MHTESDVDSDLFKYMIQFFKDKSLSFISMHQIPMGKDKFSILEEMLTKCPYSMCLITENFRDDQWCCKNVVEACRKAVDERRANVLYVKAKGFKDADIPLGLKSIQGTEYGSFGCEGSLKNTFKQYLKDKQKKAEARKKGKNTACICIMKLSSRQYPDVEEMPVNGVTIPVILISC